ncbi:hypothetical protein [Bradyrhizobium ottawaense]|uniref:hypothetical protein n=1 Tax=Bradyrhizobium ottawaense TaxID=931866 RepID=UPI0027D5B47F|nr:hypothetical protein BwSF21_21850 [Bradyrhizobium ottawaense]GMO28908.1 hypothetical protein BwSF12_26170 [Bradyrhizobium ottawaense]GMO86544.1 hypothetical protein BwSF19_46920 [Bradyrhizobium ottawaense]
MVSYKRTKPVKHRWFDQWLVARGEPLTRLVRKIRDGVEAHEKRQRARRPDDQRKHLRIIEGVVCNLAYAVISPPPTGWLAINTRNGERGKGRYDNKAFGTTYRNVLALLEADGLLQRQISDAIRGEVSSIRPSRRFADIVVAADIALAHFGRDPSQELLLLTRVTRKESPITRERTKTRKLEDYTDTPVTLSYRAAVRELNAFLDSADISFIADGIDPAVDPYGRTLTRRFTIFDSQEPRFDQVGRLFGGFWMSIKKERRKQIRVDGEPVAELDYSTMFTRLAYADLWLQPPEGDLYAIPGLEDHRSGVKLAMNCFLFDETPTRRTWPPDMAFTYETGADNAGADTIQGKLPKGWTVSRTKKAILTVHPALERAWGRGLGYRLMWQESEILMAVLRELMEQNVVALGLHDGLLVPASKAQIALEAMRRQSRAIVGVELPCSIKA